MLRALSRAAALGKAAPLACGFRDALSSARVRSVSARRAPFAVPAAGFASRSLAHAARCRAAPATAVAEAEVATARRAAPAEASCASADADAFPDMLLDKHGRRHTYLRISLTERCNLRCTYCMPADGVQLTPSKQLLTAAEIERIARLFVASGVTKIRLTGGEPTVRADLEDIATRLGRLPGLRDFGITSNGIVLAKKLPALRDAGLTAVNISLDTLVPAKFELLTRRAGHDRVLASVRAALAAGFTPVKLNCVVMRGVNDDELLDFVALTRDADINVRFIEYMPFDGNAWASRKMVPYAEMRATVAAAHPGMARLDDAPDEVAKNFRVPGHVGSVSFISSMTSHFCAGCSRLRLLADGALKVCLFGASEVSLRDPLRAGADNAALAAVIAGAVARKKPAHDGVPVAQLFERPNRAMIRIGG